MSRKGVGLRKAFFDVEDRGSGVELRIVIDVAGQRDRLRVVGSGRVAVLLGGHVRRLEFRERRVAVRIGGEIRRSDVGRAVVEFEREGLCGIRLVPDVEEALHPAVVNIRLVVFVRVDVVNVHRVGGRRVERGDGRAVLAVHKGDGRARRAAADLARLCPEGDEHIFVGVERERVAAGIFFERCRVRSPVGGHEHDNVFRTVVAREGELAVKVLVDNVAEVDVIERFEVVVGVQPDHALPFCGRRPVGSVVFDLGFVRLAARGFLGHVGGNAELAAAEVERYQLHIQIERKRAGIIFVSCFEDFVVVLLGVAVVVEVADIIRSVEVSRLGIVSLVGDDGADKIVEEGVAVDRFIAVVRRAAAQPERDGERRLGEGVGAQVQLVLLPFAVRLNVGDRPVVERGAAYRLRDLNIRARAGRRGLPVLAVFERVGAHPHGKLGGSTLFQRNGRTRGVVLTRTEHFVGSAAVVDHENGGIALRRARALRGSGCEFGEILHVLEVDGVLIVREQFRRVGRAVQIVDLILEEGIEAEAVVNRHVAVLPMADDVVQNGVKVAVLRDARKEAAAGSGQRLPFGDVDDARGRIRRGRTGRERPVGGGCDEVALVGKRVVHLVVKFKVAVADLLGIRLSRGRLLIVRSVVRRVRCAGGEDAERKACGECDGERGNGAASPFFFSEICHMFSLLKAADQRTPSPIFPNTFLF